MQTISTYKKVKVLMNLQTVLKGQFTQKFDFCHYLLTLMSFQTFKTFVHLQNTNEDLFYKI